MAEQTDPPPPSRAALPAAGRRLLRHAADLLLPQRCLVCGAFGASLHEECLEELPEARGPRCVRCWRPGAGTWCERCAVGGTDAPAFDGLRTPYRFEGFARRAVLEAKFRGITEHLRTVVLPCAEAVPAEWRFDVVVPVPLTASRRRRRGFNQSAILARGVARHLGAGWRDRLVVRTRGGTPQAQLSAERRATSVRDAFAVHGVPPPGVLVVDDVTTTGATLSAVAAVLKAAGAERVYGLAIARED